MTNEMTNTTRARKKLAREYQFSEQDVNEIHNEMEKAIADDLYVAWTKYNDAQKACQNRRDT